MNKKICLLVCVCSLFCGILPAAIRQINQMDEILPEITDDTLVLFDIDDTLIYPTAFITHRHWKNWMRATLAQLYPGDREKQAEIYGTANLGINLISPTTLVEAKTPALIATLQRRGVQVYAMTMRGQNYWYSYPVAGVSKFTVQHLHAVGIHFDQSPVLHAFHTYPAFENGIIFTGAKDKGPFLIHLLNHIGYRPRKVVFVDDTLDQVVSVVEAMQQEGIKSVGFRYSAASEKPFDLNACVVQFKHMYEQDALISNEDALQKTAELSSIDPNDCFHDYLFNHYERLKLSYLMR